MFINVDAVHRTEIGLIKSLQLFRNPLLDSVMIFLSFLDTLPFYLLFVAAVWYLYSQKCGLNLAYLLVISLLVNSDAKEFFALPRPFVLAPDVGLERVPDFGFPSGAAQTTVALFGFVALAVQKRWLWILSMIGVLLISLSRVYLGIHFPSDIIGGWAIGAAVLGIYCAVVPFFESVFLGQPKMTLLYLSVIATLFGTFLCLNEKLIEVVLFGFGVSVGYIAAPNEAAVGTYPKRVLKLVVALSGIVLLQEGAALAFRSAASWPILASLPGAASSFLSGFWLAFGPSVVVRRNI